MASRACRSGGMKKGGGKKPPKSPMAKKGGK